VSNHASTEVDAMKCGCILAVVGGLLGWSRVASACELLPEEGALRGSVPLEGESLPSNAVLVLEGLRLTEHELTATADGTPIAVRRVDAPFPIGSDLLLLAFDPPLQAGQTLHVGGRACVPYDPMFIGDPEYTYDESKCDIDLTFTVVDAIVTTPPTPTGLELHVRDHTIDDPASVPGCGDPPVREYEVGATIDVSDAAATFVSVRVFEPDEPELDVARTQRTGDDGVVVSPLRSWEEALGNAPCVEVHVWDATLAVAPVLASCGATTCVLEDYDGGVHGECDAAAADGCSCAGGDPRWAWLALVGLIPLRRRRSARARVLTTRASLRSAWSSRPAPRAGTRRARPSRRRRSTRS
jgi:MYXO-CTERM domain-containing protein